MNEKVKAIALLSPGGLDSILAIRALLDQGVEVTGLHFVLPFCSPDPEQNGSAFAEIVAEKLGIEFILGTMDDEYLDIIRDPKHGHGSGMNPCIDCKIYMLRRARELADKTGAAFVTTGEVLNQRPMSQHRIALAVLEKESGLKGRLLRPLSAKYLPETDAEKAGIIDRKKFPSIMGRGRRIQLDMAKELGIDYFIPAAGGCLLTDKFFIMKLRDILQYRKDASWEDAQILNFGRHFRFGSSKIIVGRREKENEMLLKLKKPEDYVFQLPGYISGPVTILQDDKTEEAVELAAALTLRYSDLKEISASVECACGLIRTVQADISVLEKADYFNLTSGKKE